MKILINATNVVGSGPKALALSLLPELSNTLSKHALRLLLPDTAEFINIKLASNNQRYFFPRATGIKNNLLRMHELYLGIPRHAREFGAHACLTLGDVGVQRLQCSEIVFLQNSLFVYPVSELHGHSSWGPIKGWYLKRCLQRTLGRVAAVVVQTPVMRDRLIDSYCVDAKRVCIVGQPAPVHVKTFSESKALHDVIAGTGERLKLLFLAQYYPHKNHAILPSVCVELKRRNLHDRVRLYTTLTTEEWARLQPELENSAVVVNLGRLKPDEVASALRTSDALFLPTMVESYGLVYLESMLLNRPILTSNRDFAHYIAKDFAIYFDPLDSVSIVNAIQALPQFIEEWPAKQGDLKRHLDSFPVDWGTVAEQFRNILELNVDQ